jgi:Transposase DDE domain
LYFDDIIQLLKLNHKPLTLGGRPPCLSVSEICTITLLQKEFNIGNKKALYKYLLAYHKSDFPNLGTYKSFNGAMNNYSKYLLQIIVFLMQVNYNQSGQLVFIDSTNLPVCKIWRQRSHKVMKRLATKSKTTTGWFYGLKLHILCYEYGNLLKIAFTTANVDDRVILDEFLEKIKNKIIGADGGYVSQKCQEKAKETDNILLNVIRSNMKGVGAMWQQKVLKMRSIVERCFSVMKTRLGLVNTLARSVNGYLAHYIRCLFMYCFKDWLRLGV